MPLQRHSRNPRLQLILHQLPSPPLKSSTTNMTMVIVIVQVVVVIVQVVVVVMIVMVVMMIILPYLEISIVFNGVLVKITMSGLGCRSRAIIPLATCRGKTMFTL